MAEEPKDTRSLILNGVAYGLLDENYSMDLEALESAFVKGTGCVIHAVDGANKKVTLFINARNVALAILNTEVLARPIEYRPVRPG